MAEGTDPPPARAKAPGPLQRLVRPLRHAAAAFFKRDLALRREGLALHLVLEERPAAAPLELGRAEQARRKDGEDLARIRAELAALLDELPDTRATMRHLVFVEHALAKKGLRALHKVPLDVLQRAHEQLEGLVVNWSPLGLAALRSKMAVAVMEREHMEPPAPGAAPRGESVLDALPAEAPAQAPAGQDDDALAAAYAGLGLLASQAGTGEPAGIELQTELGARSRRAVPRAAADAAPQPDTEPAIRIRALES